MTCLRPGASQPKYDPQIPQLREEAPGFGRLALGGINYHIPSSHDVGGLPEMIDDDILAYDGISGGTVFLHKSVGLIVRTLRPFLGKLDGVVFIEPSPLSFRLLDLRFDRSWLMDNRRIPSPEPCRRAGALPGQPRCVPLHRGSVGFRRQTGIRWT